VPVYGDVAAGTDPTDHVVPFHWRTKSWGVPGCQAPAIQQLVVLVQVRAGFPTNWTVPLVGLGVVIRVHDEPFQFRVRSCSPAVGLSTPESPTAQQSELESQLTEVSSELDTPRLGKDDSVHHVPFQLRASAAVAAVLDEVSPTAQQSLVDTHVTELGKTDTLGANRLPRDPNAHAGPGGAAPTVKFWTDEVLVA